MPLPPIQWVCCHRQAQMLEYTKELEMRDDAITQIAKLIDPDFDYGSDAVQADMRALALECFSVFLPSTMEILSEREALREENARLREALKPFVDRLAVLEETIAHKYAIGTNIDVEHIRAARAAIREGGDAPQRWRHVKTGGVYEVVGKCVIEETLKPAVLYRSIIQAPDKPVWARPKDEFYDGRFVKIEDAAAIQEGSNNEKT